MAVLAGVLGWLVAGAFYSALSGRWTTSWTFALGYVGTFTLVYSLLSFLATRERPPSLTFAPDRVELVAARCDGVVVPADAITRIQVRAWWPFALLDLFVREADGARIVSIDRTGRRAPAKRRGGELRFRMPLAGLDVAAVRAELSKRANGDGVWRSEDATARTAGGG
ncbi:hypothetical protein [Paractinoplanes abujensis]|uniref:Uncharacterized protein n=1 Tax=Paractinoplanes abujensis TaxID=882441 RepID=A0A7W7CP47_9ACTN|nr:hypothetical protein [Actinoplanes abujensis]MBB4692142.1 hypothetical protein [Actinoplanes abujensis]